MTNLALAAVSIAVAILGFRSDCRRAARGWHTEK